MFVTTCLKTRGVCTLNGPTYPEPEANKEAEKATCLAEKEEQTLCVSDRLEHDGFNNETQF